MALFFPLVALPIHNIKCYVCSKAEEHCTFDGMHKAFMESASKVGTDGIFVFCFSGYGMKVGDNEWGLAPADFNYTKEKFITAATFISWLQCVQFKGQYALFVLDCCYAGGIAEQLAKETVNADVPIPGLFVFTSCTANESSLVVNALDHSIFNYFLTSCLFNSNSQPGQLKIKTVYEDCNACCMAFSSLLLSYKAENDLLKWSMIQPEFKYFQLPRYLQSLYQEEREETDTGPPGRFQVVTEYYKFQKKGSRQQPPVLADKSLAWLETVSQPEGALFELHNRRLLVGRLLSAAIASMMYSMASIFIACNQDNIADINVFIVSFIHVIAAVDRVHQNLHLTRRDLMLALEYYFDALRRNKINAGDLKSLYKCIVNDIATEQLHAASSPEKGGQEFTSSGEMSQKVIFETRHLIECILVVLFK